MSKTSKQFCKENLGKEIITSKYIYSTEGLDQCKGMIVGYVEDDEDNKIIISFEDSTEGWTLDVTRKEDNIKVLIQSPLCKSYWIKNVNAYFNFV